MRRVAWLLAMAVLLSSGMLGLFNGVSDLPDAATPPQLAVTGCVLAYAVFGFAAAWGLARRRRWSAWVALLWTIAATGAAAGGVLVYADPATPRSAVYSAGGVAALIGILVVLTARMWTRRAPAAPAPEPAS